MMADRKVPSLELRVSAPTRVKSESLIFTTIPGDGFSPKYAKPPTGSMTPDRTLFSPELSVSEPTRVKSESLTLTIMPGWVLVPK